MKILAIGAHADDVELACGGTIARAVAAGHEVHVYVLSDSAYARYDGRVLRTVAQAAHEAGEAWRILGVTDYVLGPFPKKEIGFEAHVIEAIEQRIERVEPNWIFTHWPHGSHQDHQAVAKATLAAARWHDSILMYEPMMPDGRTQASFRPQVYADVSDHLDTKLAALRAHASQALKYGTAWLEAVRARCAVRGFEMGVRYAEAFEAVRWRLAL